MTQEQATELLEKLPKHRFVPRFIGIVTGFIGAAFVGSKLRDASLSDFVRKGLHPEVNDTFVTAAKATIDKALQATHEGATETLKAIDPRKLLRWQKAETLFEARKAQLIKDHAEIVTKHELTKKLAKNIAESQKAMRNIARADNGLKYYLHEAKMKAFAPEIAKEMQMGIRHSYHKNLIFAASAVALCAVGYGVYKVTDRLMNKDTKTTHQQAVTDSRSTAGAPAGIRFQL